MLDPSRDPSPDAAYEMGHPAFLLAWEDGRRLLVDAGMDREAALAFGRRLELVGAGPPEAHGSAAEQLRRELGPGPLGLVFTHLHVDHTEGVAGVCAARAGGEITLFQTPAQAARRNYTTRSGAEQLAGAGCLRPALLAETSPTELPGFPGVAVAWGAGHTPGSQLVFVWLRAAGGEVRRLVLAGDIANAIDGVRHDVPKPRLYRLLVVPEHDAQLGRLRRFLAGLEREGSVVLPSHDLIHLRSVGLPFAR